MPDIVNECASLSEVPFKAEACGDRRSKLHDFDTMCQPTSKMIIGCAGKQLGLVRKALQRNRPKYAITVTLKAESERIMTRNPL
jgi:hypothetical protein